MSAHTRSNPNPNVNPNPTVNPNRNVNPNPTPNAEPQRSDPHLGPKPEPKPKPGKSLPARVRLVGRRALPYWTLLHGGYVLLFVLLLQPALLPPPLQVTHSPAACC